MRNRVTRRIKHTILGAMQRGRFITFEGGDGVGKSTQIQRLAQHLLKHGIDCVVTREPGGTPFAERVRDFILAGQLPAHPPMAEALLFAAARYDHIAGLIRPALEEGRWVLSDRFSDSTQAYQGAAGGGDLSALMQLEVLTVADCAPELTIVLDLEPMTGRARIAERGGGLEVEVDPFEGRDLAFQTRLRQAFLDIATEHSERCKVVEAGQSLDTVEAEVWQHVVVRFELEAG